MRRFESYRPNTKMTEDNSKNEITYPMRINRYLALRNYCSRREADELIVKGVVLINVSNSLAATLALA